jgi:mRNA-degrading endonuclease toxin of MazEF toxin-antitoxin module
VTALRGEVWRYRPVLERGDPNLRLVVSANAINQDSRLVTVYAAKVITEDAGSLLSVAIGEHGWALMTEIERPLKSRLLERVGDATPDEIETVSIALRAAFDL